MSNYIRGVPALRAKYERLFEAHARLSRLYVAALQELAELRAAVAK